MIQYDHIQDDTTRCWCAPDAYVVEEHETVSVMTPFGMFARSDVSYKLVITHYEAPTLRRRGHRPLVANQKVLH